MSKTTSLRETIERLTDELVEQIFKAARPIIQKEIAEREGREGGRRVSKAVASTRSMDRASSSNAPASPASGVRRMGGKRGRKRRTEAEDAPPVAVRSKVRKQVDAAPAEPTGADDTAINPELLLRAFDSGPADGTSSSNGLPALLEAPNKAEAKSEPAKYEPGPALRQDEVAIRTTGGAVVIRRKKNAALTA